MSKPRPPKVNPDFSWDSIGLPPDIFSLRQRFNLLEAERRAGRIEKTFIAFEALTAFCGGRDSGYSDNDLRKAWLPEWGTESVVVPYALLTELALAWVEYHKAPSGKSFGETLGIEGGGQGKSPSREKSKANDAMIARARAVLLEYIDAARAGQPIALDRACEIVAEKFEISFDAVAAAYKKHGKRIKNEMTEIGALLKG